MQTIRFVLGKVGTRWSRLMAPVCVVLLGACGGGGGGSVVGTPINALTVGADAAFDGYVGVSGILNTAGQLKIGDEESLGADRDFRSFVGFDLGGLPAGATVVAATLRCYLVQVDGAPYASLGNILAIHVALGPTLDFGEFTGGEIATAGTLSSSPAFGWKELDVTARVQADLAGVRTRTQFRLQCASADGNGDGFDTMSEFESADNTLGTGFWPELVISYTAP